MKSRDEAPPANALEALERARHHARRAGVELIAAARALLDAASLGWNGEPSERNATLRPLALGLDELCDRLESDEAEIPKPLARAVLVAMDEQIEQWQRRSEEDPDARAVLRAFLSVRELLWELGFRHPEPAQAPAAARSGNSRQPSAKPQAGKSPPSATRVRRIARIDDDARD